MKTPPLASHDKSILAVVTDDPLPIKANVLRRSDIAALSDWILGTLLDRPVPD
jgi:hypothetical protein